MSSNSAARGGRRVGIVLVLTSTVAFAIGPIAAKIAFDNGSNVLTVVAARGLIGAALLALLVVLFRQTFRIDRAALRWCLACSVFSALMVYGFIGAAVILGQWLRPMQWIGAAIMIGAIVLFEAAGRHEVRDERSGEPGRRAQ